MTRQVKPEVGIPGLNDTVEYFHKGKFERFAEKPPQSEALMGLGIVLGSCGRG